MFTIPELVAAHKKLGFSPVLIQAALESCSNRKTFTLDEARKLISLFASLEVKPCK